MANAGSFFGKYIGVQGVLSIVFAVGYVAAPYAKVELPGGYTEIMTLLIGMYAQRNGSNILNAGRNAVTRSGGS